MQIAVAVAVAGKKKKGFGCVWSLSLFFYAISADLFVGCTGVGMCHLSISLVINCQRVVYA